MPDKPIRVVIERSELLEDSPRRIAAAQLAVRSAIGEMLAYPPVRPAFALEQRLVDVSVTGLRNLNAYLEALGKRLVEAGSGQLICRVTAREEEKPRG